MSLWSDFLIKVHSWYPMNCCGNADCRPVDCSTLVDSGKDWIMNGTMHFAYEKVYPSLDGLCHACFTSEGYLQGICLFIQMNT